MNETYIGNQQQEPNTDAAEHLKAPVFRDK